MKRHILKIREVDKKVFDSIRAGEKKIETRKASEKYMDISVGDILVFICGEDSVEKEVVRKDHFMGIEEMLKVFGLKQIMPFANSVEEMKQIYYSFPGYKEEIEDKGLIAFEIK